MFSSSIYIMPNAIPLANYTSSLSNVTVLITESSGPSGLRLFSAAAAAARCREGVRNLWSIGGEGRVDLKVMLIGWIVKGE
jgi:hypothetical protein